MYMFVCMFVDVSLVSGMLSAHHGWVRRVCWSPVNDHQLVSGSYDNTARLWDIRRLKEYCMAVPLLYSSFYNSPKVPVYTITAHEDKLLCLDWSVPKVTTTVM